MTTSASPLLPRPTDPVKQPIINSPYHSPEYHWDLDYSAKAIDNVLDGRRVSQNIPPVAGSRKTRGRVMLPGQFGAVWTPLDLVNDIREAASKWQGAGCPGITQTSRDLINHWTDPEACQPYFAQIDAVLTHIYLHEAATEELRERVREINLKHNDGIHRIAHKMATATGKTPVMAMLILYHAANYRNAAPDDHWFVRRFLVITPGLTVKERLEDSLDPGHQDNEWTAFSLVPPGDQWEMALASASVKVINYHQMQPEDIEAEHLLADKGYDSDQIAAAASARGINPVVPPGSNRKEPRDYDKDLYKLRHMGGNGFLHLKQWRGVVTHYAKRSSSFLAICQIRALVLWTKLF